MHPVFSEMFSHQGLDIDCHGIFTLYSRRTKVVSIPRDWNRAQAVTVLGYYVMKQFDSPTTNATNSYWHDLPS